MIEKDPNLPEGELSEILKASTIHSMYWSALENQKLLEAYELFGWDYSAISQHVVTKSNDQVKNKRMTLVREMKTNPTMPMSHFLYTDSKVLRQKAKWTESEEQKFSDAVRKVGNNPYQISSIVSSKTC